MEIGGISEFGAKSREMKVEAPQALAFGSGKKKEPSALT